MNPDASTYSTSAHVSTLASAAKLIPCPGVSAMGVSMSAFWFSPAAQSCAISCSLPTPAGSSLDTTPAKIRLVPSPSSRGPITCSGTLITDPASTSSSHTRSGRSFPSSRFGRRPEVHHLLGPNIHPRERSPASRSACRTGNAYAVGSCSFGRANPALVPALEVGSGLIPSPPPPAGSLQFSEVQQLTVRSAGDDTAVVEH
jgi:hypothetical protein